ncbi:MAG TPA: thioredoxin-dependent thiol peroxidase [bacterium]|jgi:peroxiredoxin Q/BCP|nr:thioredoxin-dependent thiol peroxidase [bacterium]
MLKEGQKAPDFKLDDQTGKPVSLKDFKGKTVVLYFYPKDMTPGCTQEACDFRDNWIAVKKKGAVVLGVSADPVLKHQTFIKKYELPFILLSDEKKDVLKEYGVWKKKKFMGREFMGIVRTTLIIDGDGKIKKIWDKVSVKDHVKEVLENL